MQIPSRLKGNSYKIYLVLLFIASLALAGLICWFLRNVVTIRKCVSLKSLMIKVMESFSFQETWDFQHCHIQSMK